MIDLNMFGIIDAFRRRLILKVLYIRISKKEF